MQYYAILGSALEIYSMFALLLSFNVYKCSITVAQNVPTSFVCIYM